MLSPDELMNNLPLTAQSKVFVAGAYQGAMMKFIYDKYGCDMYGFEPQLDMCEAARALGLRVFNYGLGVRNDARAPMINAGNDACTYIVGAKTPELYTQMRAIDTVLSELDLWHVDLFIMNMEGYELTLLPYMIETHEIYLFDNLMVQFHPQFGSGDELIETITRLGFTMNCDARPAWVGWCLE